MAGSSGMIGNAFLEQLEEYEIWPITRIDLKLNDDEFIKKYETADILMNFAGESIIKRWTPKNKTKILESRINTTRKIGLISERGMQKKRIFILWSC